MVSVDPASGVTSAKSYVPSVLTCKVYKVSPLPSTVAVSSAPFAFCVTVLVTPSREFVAGLPFGKIPDRSDFQRLDYEERVSYWQAVMDKSQLLAEEFATLVDTGVGVEQIKELHP